MHDPAWALTPAGLARVLGEVERGRSAIVECGSGASTITLAGALARRGGNGHLHSLEHDRDWHARTCAALEREGLSEFASMILAPLRPHPLAGPAGWYDTATLDRLPEAIDLLLVDGPPGSLEPDGETRYPALPLLAPLLAPGAIVVLDDIHRPGERAVLERWGREHAIKFEPHQRERLAIGVFWGAQDPATAGTS